MTSFPFMKIIGYISFIFCNVKTFNLKIIAVLQHIESNEIWTNLTFGTQTEKQDLKLFLFTLVEAMVLYHEIGFSGKDD